MMWTYCFLAFIVFLILLIIYLFRYKRKKHFKTTSYNCVGYGHFDTSSFGNFLFLATRYAIE